MKVSATSTGSAAVRAGFKQLAMLGSRAIDRLAEEVETFVEDAAGQHSKSGKLFASVTKERARAGWWIGHRGQVAPHAKFVHWGTRPHIIRPKNRKVLRWPSGNGFAFAGKVRHPGYRGDPWLTRAAAMAPAAFDKHVRALLAQRGA